MTDPVWSGADPDTGESAVLPLEQMIVFSAAFLHSHVTRL